MGRHSLKITERTVVAYETTRPAAARNHSINIQHRPDGQGSAGHKPFALVTDNHFEKYTDRPPVPSPRALYVMFFYQYTRGAGQKQ